MTLKRFVRWGLPAGLGIAALVVAAGLPGSGLPGRGGLQLAAQKAGAAGVVSQTPLKGAAVVQDGTVQASAVIGTTIYLGGTFTKIRTAKGTVVTQPYLAAVSATTGDLITGFTPKLNKEVRTLHAGYKSTELVAGGDFTEVNGTRQAYVAKLNAATGASLSWPVKVAGFHTYEERLKGTHVPSTQVRTLARSGDRLFIGGNFTSVNGENRAGLAEVSLASGGVAAKFRADITEDVNAGILPEVDIYEVVPGVMVSNLLMIPGTTKLIVVHRGHRVAGQLRPGVAILDVMGDAPVVTPWSTDFWKPSAAQLRLARKVTRRLPVPDTATVYPNLVNAAVSPDGKMFVLAAHGGNVPPHHNMALAFPVTSGAHTKPLWITQNLHATLAVAVSKTAVYVGGHFCYTEGPLSKPEPMFFPGRAVDAPCEPLSEKIASGKNRAMFVPRRQLAALDLKTGRALNWAPGADGKHGITLLAIAFDDLLIGHDGTTVGGQKAGGFAILRD